MVAIRRGCLICCNPDSSPTWAGLFANSETRWVLVHSDRDEFLPGAAGSRSQTRSADEPFTRATRATGLVRPGPRGTFGDAAPAHRRGRRDPAPAPPPGRSHAPPRARIPGDDAVPEGVRRRVRPVGNHLGAGVPHRRGHHRHHAGITRVRIHLRTAPHDRQHAGHVVAHPEPFRDERATGKGGPGSTGGSRATSS